MLQEVATVIAANSSTLTVETRARSSCSSCSNDSCTTSVVSKLFNVSRNRFELDNALDAHVGDEVIVSIPDGLLVRASIWVYLIPSLLMLLAAGLGVVSGLDDGMQALIALLGLGFGFWLVGLLTRMQTLRDEFKPQLERILTDSRIVIFPATNRA